MAEKQTEEKQINFSEIEKKWQKKWEQEKAFEVKESSKKKYCVLEMFPYPSGEGLHIGHAFNYTIGDIYARYKRMKSFNVLYPMGYDSLGLPAENAAIKAGIHPEEYTEKSIANFMKQQKALGLSYDWTRMIKTSSPDYYKWDQWIFLKMLEKNFAYRKKAPVNFCPKCNTVLANEQVHNGKCWRHPDTNIEIKHLEQWFFKITEYADELLEKIDELKWPDRIKAMQKNWIGKSYGTEIDFEVVNENQNCIIVHGCPSDEEKAKDSNRRTYDKHWIPWIKKKLEEKGINAIIPLMPEPWKANYSKWKKEFGKLKVNENTILIGHSCGCAFLVRWLGETKKKISKLILVAPWKIAGSGNGEKEFYDYEIDNEIKNRINKIIIFTSNNEESDGKKSVKIFGNDLDAKIIELRNRGHFTSGDMNTDEFPELLDSVIGKWKIFTTRPDTIFGVTFMVVSAQHPRLAELITDNQKNEVEEFLKKIKTTSKKDLEELEKQGVFTGSYAINPVTHEKIPVYAGNFVIAEYGSGMVMAVPAHDQRDFEFAKKYNIPIKVVINPVDYELNAKKMSRAFTGSGKLTNSEKFNGWSSEEAIDEITNFLQEKNIGRKSVQYKLRDWLISRQRYWGTPIPIIYCDKCGIVPVDEKNLPVKLPKEIKFGEGNPLATNQDFVNVKCPKCGGNAKRETDTMDTFVNSSWYFLRYCDAHNDKEIFDKTKVKYWMPVDQYIGGAEHACMHLIYFRFYTKFLRDLGLLDFDEPAIDLFNQGMVHAQDGRVMAKSLGNTIDPLEIIEKCGVDSLRLFLISVASPDKDFNWSDKGIEGSLKFIKKVLNYFDNVQIESSSKRIESKINKTIKEISEYIEDFKYNLAVIKLRNLFDIIEEEGKIGKQDLESFVKMLSVFCPHICEEIWEKLGGKGFVSLAKWPVCNKNKIDEELEKQAEFFEKTVEDINQIISLIKDKQEKNISNIYLYVIPNELETYDEERLSKRTGKQVKVFAVNNSEKYDPNEKSGKAKPGRPAIYVE